MSAKKERLKIAELYIEGGGKGGDLDDLFRKAWRSFFEAAGLKGRMPRIICGRGRSQAFEAFKIALANHKKDENPLPLLVVDSETAVIAGESPWKHLQRDPDDRWAQPSGSTDDHVYLMVQVMETWFLADQDLLRRYFGSKLHESHFKDWPALEEVPKKTVLDALKNATRDCATPYSKGKVSFDLLGQLDPKKVEEKCPNAKRLLKYLRSL